MSETKPEKSEHEGAGILLALVLMLPMYAVWGWATATTWSWFVAPLLPPTAPHIAIGHFVGIALLMSLWREHKNTSKSIWDTLKEGTLNHLVNPLFVVGLGWVIHRFWL